MTKKILALVLVSSLGGCAYRADLPPAAAAASGKNRPPPTPPAAEAAKPDDRPTRVGIRFYFKEPVPADWTIGTVSDGRTEAGVMPLCLLTHRLSGSRIILLLKSYLEPGADPKAYQRRVMGDSLGWLATMPPEFGAPGLFGDDPGTGYVGVGTFEGMDDRWLIAAGRWRADDHHAMFADMQKLIATVSAASTATAKGITDPTRQVCYDYY